MSTPLPPPPTPVNHGYATVLKRSCHKPLIPPANYSIVQTNTARFDQKEYHINGDDFHRLERHVIYSMNSSQPMKCYASAYGSICIFTLPKDDIRYLNSLTYQLTHLANIQTGYVHYLHDDDKPVFFPYHRDTRLFNRLAQPITRADFINTFQGKVAITVKGIRISDDYHIYLDAYIHQVKVEEEDDISETRAYDCIFE